MIVPFPRIPVPAEPQQRTSPAVVTPHVRRCAAVGWIQSRVRDAIRREVLFDLERVRRSAFAREPDGEEYALLSQATGNLLRMWGET
jgi:predicted 2-oxoglutarate/Fe(II)-dependent dioxygenase YbiX